MRDASADSPDDSADPGAERDLSSLACLLRYAMCEAEALGQTNAAALIDAAIFSLRADDTARAAGVVDRLPAGGDRPRKVPAKRPARAYNRKFC